MDRSIDGVTLISGFVFDLLRAYESKRMGYVAKLFDMAKHLDPENPNELVPIQLYNDMCQWIEDEIGVASLRRAGVAIGNRAYVHLAQKDLMVTEPSPLQIMQGLKRATSTLIQDPKGRGWEILEAKEGLIVMRRTQTFNCILQEGLLKSLVNRTGARLVEVDHIACTRKGAEFCEYAVKWLVAG